MSCGNSEAQVHSHLSGFPSVTGPEAGPLFSKNIHLSVNTSGGIVTFESISAAGMGIGFLWAVEDK